MSIVICHTEGCGNEGEPVDMELTGTDFEGNEYTVTDVFCGGCGQQITDITDAEPDPPLARALGGRGGDQGGGGAGTGG